MAIYEKDDEQKNKDLYVKQNNDFEQSNNDHLWDDESF